MKWVMQEKQVFHSKYWTDGLQYGRKPQFVFCGTVIGENLLVHYNVLTTFFNSFPLQEVMMDCTQIAMSLPAKSYDT